MLVTKVTVSLPSEVWATGLAMRIDKHPDFEAQAVLLDTPERLLGEVLESADIALVSLDRYEGFEAAMGAGVTVGLVFESDLDRALDLYIDNSRRPFIEVNEMTTMEILSATLKLFVMGKNHFIPRVFADQIFARQAQKSYSDKMGLSPAERDVMTLIAQGLTNQAIAGIRFTQPRTVEHHVNEIFSKLGLSDAYADGFHGRVKAVTMWLTAGDSERGMRDALYGATTRDAAAGAEKNGKVATA